MDSDRDFMKAVSSAISQGHYIRDKVNPYAFYRLNGEKRKGFVGKYTEVFKTFKTNTLEIESVYFGDRRTKGFSFSFYDKELEENGNLSKCKTRVELRLNASCKNPIPKELLESIRNMYLSSMVYSALVLFILKPVYSTKKIKFFCRLIVSSLRERGGLD